MEFTSAFNNINQLTTKQFRYDYQFNGHQISILADTTENHFQLFVIISLDNLQVCRQLNIYIKDGKYQFNAFWKTDYFPQVFEALAKNNKLTPFWNDLIQRLTNLKDANIDRVTPTQYQNTITRVTQHSDDTSYLSHLRKSNMSQRQFDKIARLYGRSVANKVRSMGCTLVFDKDPLKSHTIIIDDLIIK